LDENEMEDEENDIVNGINGINSKSDSTSGGQYNS